MWVSYHIYRGNENVGGSVSAVTEHGGDVSTLLANGGDVFPALMANGGYFGSRRFLVFWR